MVGEPCADALDDPALRLAVDRGNEVSGGLFRPCIFGNASEVPRVDGGGVARGGERRIEQKLRFQEASCAPCGDARLRAAPNLPRQPRY